MMIVDTKANAAKIMTVPSIPQTTFLEFHLSFDIDS